MSDGRLRFYCPLHPSSGAPTEDGDPASGDSTTCPQCGSRAVGRNPRTGGLACFEVGCFYDGPASGDTT